MSSKSTENYPEMSLEQLDASSKVSKCPCCGETSGPNNPFDLTPRCHPKGGTWVSYWGGMFYIRCAACDKPVIKINCTTPLTLCE